MLGLIVRLWFVAASCLLAGAIYSNPALFTNVSEFHINNLNPGHWIGILAALFVFWRD
jgi:hypothetical protein